MKIVSTFSFVALALLPILACGGQAADTSGTSIDADQVEIVKGVADQDRDPAVIAIDIAGDALCTGTLLAPDVVLTARHCVAKLTSDSVDCGSSESNVGAVRAASSFTILAGDDASTAKAIGKGAKVFTTSGSSLCNEDIALILLTEPVTGIAPAKVRATGVAKGDHVRSVGYGKSSDTGGAGVKLYRDHVKVLDVAASEFEVGEATCQGDSGGPAFDEDTGEIVGVVSRGGPSCDGSDVHNIYTRADAHLALINEALAASHASTSATAKNPASDLGSACTKGSDCSAGICITENGKQYCSRPCASGDRCPAHFRCEKATKGNVSACVES